MGTWSKAGLYQNAQSASYLPLTLVGNWLQKRTKSSCAGETQQFLVRICITTYFLVCAADFLKVL